MTTKLETWQGQRPLDNPLTVLVRFPRRSYGGYLVVRADNGRELGWVYHSRDGWSAYASQSAFRGASLADSGDVLDDVPLHLFDGLSSVQNNPLGTQFRTREQAAQSIFYQLVRYQATAITGQPHPLVRPYERSVV